MERIKKNVFMKPDYKKWMQKGMVMSAVIGTVVFSAVYYILIDRTRF